MDIFWDELTLGLPDKEHLIRVFIRLIAATILGAAVGIQRERAGKPAGLRTHILVTLGTCVFVLACIGFGMQSDALSRVIQGIVTGIGFIGAGSILKLDNERSIKGLTTSAGILLTAAIGVAVGLGELGLGILSTIMALIVLAFIGSFEFRMEQRREIKKKKRAEEQEHITD